MPLGVRSTLLPITMLVMVAASTAVDAAGNSREIDAVANVDGFGNPPEVLPPYCAQFEGFPIHQRIWTGNSTNKEIRVSLDGTTTPLDPTNVNYEKWNPVVYIPTHTEFIVYCKRRSG